MKTKKFDCFFFLVLVLSLILLNYADFVKAYYCNLIYLEQNKDAYYLNEEIHLNSSWELNYNPNNEISYIQIQISDEKDLVIWNSSKYYDIGIQEENWKIGILNLKPSISYYPQSFFIKFLNFYYHIDTMNSKIIVLHTKEIEINKRDLACNLFKLPENNTNNILYGEHLQFNLEFYDEILQNKIIPFNESILFRLKCNDEVIYNNSYLLNSSGEITVTIPVYIELKPNEYSLIFFVQNNTFYYDRKFEFEINIEKTVLNIEVIKFSEKIKKDEDVEIQ
ncbi:MAG: hypothetical protein ACFFDN_34005, partial [Candidatus Hodarchaeota archaeon]